VRALLDVNVWVALFDDAHVFSARANAFVETAGVQIATCPIVENGVVRVMSLPSYGRRGGVPLHRVRERLREACAALDHAFGPTTSLCARTNASTSLASRATTRSPTCICWRWPCATAGGS